MDDQCEWRAYKEVVIIIYIRPLSNFEPKICIIDTFLEKIIGELDDNQINEQAINRYGETIQEEKKTSSIKVKSQVKGNTKPYTMFKYPKLLHYRVRFCPSLYRLCIHPASRISHVISKLC